MTATLPMHGNSKEKDIHEACNTFASHDRYLLFVTPYRSDGLQLLICTAHETLQLLDN